MSILARCAATLAALLVAVGITVPPIHAFELDEARLGINVTGIELWTWQPMAGWEKHVALDTVEAELLFTPPSGTVLSYLGDPRINFGGHLSTKGRASMVRAGLTWGSPLFDSPVFIEGTLGVALTNSTLANSTPPDRNVGCPVLLYFAGNLGYRIDQNWSVMGTVYHASHATLCGFGAPNRGLNGYGIKIGYSF